MEGTIKWFNTKKGYGFITGEDGVEYFFHYTALPEQTRVNDNDRVTFDATETERGKQAQNIKLIEGGAASDTGEQQADDDQEPSEEESSEDFGEDEEKQAA